MVLSQEALANKPKRPLNAYFAFRTDRLKEMKDDPDRVQKAKDDWTSIDEKTKRNYEEKFHQEMEDWKVEE
jgi:hypothetical protein